MLAKDNPAYSGKDWEKRSDGKVYTYQTKSDGEVYINDVLGAGYDASKWTSDQRQQFIRTYENDFSTDLRRRYQNQYQVASNAQKEEDLENYKLQLQEETLAYQKAAAEAAAYQQPYQQPASEAQQAYSEAQSDSARRQNLRRGLLSLTRYGSNSSTSASGLSGKSTSLGG